MVLSATTTITATVKDGLSPQTSVIQEKMEITKEKLSELLGADVVLVHSTSSPAGCSVDSSIQRRNL